MVQEDPTERLNLMSGCHSRVKAKNVVPHDIGDPGRRKITNDREEEVCHKRLVSVIRPYPFSFVSAADEDISRCVKLKTQF